MFHTELLLNFFFLCISIVFIFSSQELRPDCGLNSRLRTINHVCGLAKVKKFEEVSLSVCFQHFLHKMKHFQNALLIFLASFVWKVEKKLGRLLGESSLSVTFKQANQSLVSSHQVSLWECNEQIERIGEACLWESVKMNE